MKINKFTTDLTDKYKAPFVLGYHFINKDILNSIGLLIVYAF
jgi:hypothetical protein